MKSRIDLKFEELRKSKKKAFIAFVTAGDPDLKTTEKLVCDFEKSGVDIVELGVPFSDPLADGPTIQNASIRALSKGVNLKRIMETVSSIRKKSDIPIALMSYYNPIFHYGETKFIKDAAKCGVDGLIIPDLPPEEAKELISQARDQNVSTIFFLAPTTKKERVSKIIEASSGFIYFVSLAGVTGARNEIPKSVMAKIRGARKLTDKPVCVGFGISNADQVKSMSKVSDGVIVGSAIVNQVAKNTGSKDLVKNVSRFVKKLNKSL